MRKNLFFSVFVLHVLLSLAACSFLEQPQTEKPPAPAGEPPATGTAKEPEVEDKRKPADKAEKAGTREKTPPAKMQAISTHIEAGEIIAALDILRAKGRPGNFPKELAGLYRRAENGAIKRGQSRLAENKPGRAGLLFRAALNSFPQDTGLAQDIILTRGELESKITVCAEKLMEQGLTVYREGRLHQAIELWEKILAFAPRHQASRNAIRTAHTQLKTLKDMN
ncbi:MAG: hypothetical protein R6X08_04370 [Desulfosalsimonadaceae bacterium]